MIFDKPKVLIGLDQNGKRSGMVSKYWAIMDDRPPAKRKGPPRSESHAEQGKPIALPETAGELRGKSEGLAVIARIRAERSPDAKAGRLPRGHLWRENLINRCTQESR